MSSADRAAIVRDLRGLGVADGDLLMVHASLRVIGATDGGSIGGAAGVLDALREVVGAGGTILVNVGVRDDWSWINEHPESERAELLRDAEPFDCLLTPADPDVGVLAEVFRTAAGSVVSDHPEGRFAAAGRLAHELTDDVPWDDYYGAGSPLERFVERGGGATSDLIDGADLVEFAVRWMAEHLTMR